MTISYPLSLPNTIGFNEVSFTAESVIARSESPFTFSQQILKFPGQRWSASVSIPPVSRDLAEDWVGFQLSLNGGENTFLLNDPNSTSPRGQGGGTPLVNGASQTGNSLNVNGATASQTNWLRTGDWFQLGSGATSRLHKVIQNVDTNASGEATVYFWPDLRSSPADSDPITLSSPKGVFRLANKVTSWSINEINSYGINFSAIEVI